MLKKTTLSFLFLACSGFATAGTMGTAPVCTPGDVTVPCASKKWDLGVQALYLRPAYTTLGYAPVSALDSTAALQHVEPDWNWGYRLEGSYHFDTGNDITLNWSHYDVDSRLGVYSGQYLQLGVPGVFPTRVIASNYQVFLDNKYNQVNLVLGQQVDMGLLKKARFYGGLQYADIRVDSTSYFTLTNPVFLAITGGGVKDFINTDFTGAGPVLGIDYSYDLTSALSITANTAGSLLCGTSRYNFSTAYVNGLVAASLYNSKKIIVPSLEAKLGAKYAYEMAHGVVNLEGGYQIVNYFNALQAKPVTSSTLVTSNFGLYGPYLGVKWLGNA